MRYDLLHGAGPDHYHFYGSLHRRQLWLEDLGQTLTASLPRSYAEKWSQLCQKFRNTRALFPPKEDLGIKTPLPLLTMLDDTPIESFLQRITDSLDTFEAELLQLFTAHQISEEAKSFLANRSSLWGRSLGQEIILSGQYKTLSLTSLDGLYELLSILLLGGSYAHNPLTLRRNTPQEIQYELAQCSHRKPYDLNLATRHLGCFLESCVYLGFIEALAPGALYKRSCVKEYCLDEIRLTTQSH